MSEDIHKSPIDTVTRILSRDERIVFAYLYGSSASGKPGNDIDIAVFLKPAEDPHRVSADLKHQLYKQTGMTPDAFDIRVLNQVSEQGDIFALLYLKNVLENGRVLVDKAPEVRADYLEQYGRRYRECEGLIREVLA